MWVDMYWAPPQCQVLCVYVWNTVENRTDSVSTLTEWESSQLKSNSHLVSTCILWGKKHRGSRSHPGRGLASSELRKTLTNLSIPAAARQAPSLCGDCFVGWPCSTYWIDRVSFVGDAQFWGLRTATEEEEIKEAYIWMMFSYNSMF